MDDRTIQISTSGNVSSYAKATLTLLKDDPNSPVVLHTRPTTPKASRTLHPSTLAAPRLISVVEKVKREYGDLWQYTECGLLVPTEEERPTLERVLDGKTKPKMSHAPYLQITLCGRPLGLEKTHNVTLQRSTGSKAEKSRVPKGKARQEEGRDTHIGDGEHETGNRIPEVAGERTGKRKSEINSGPSKRARTGQ